MLAIQHETRINPENKQDSDTIVGYRKTQKEEWISQLIWKAIEDRNQIKKHVLDAKSQRLNEKISRGYADKHKELKNRARNGKRHLL